MKMLIGVLVAVILVGAGVWIYATPAAAPPQNSGVAVIWATSPHTNCPAPAAGASLWCLGSDGLYLSVNGGTLTQVSLGGGGVTTVNGKSGVVVLTAVTTVTAPPMNASGSTITVGAPVATTVLQ